MGTAEVYETVGIEVRFPEASISPPFSVPLGDQWRTFTVPALSADEREGEQAHVPMER